MHSASFQTSWVFDSPATALCYEPEVSEYVTPTPAKLSPLLEQRTKLLVAPPTALKPHPFYRAGNKHPTPCCPLMITKCFCFNFSLLWCSQKKAPDWGCDTALESLLSMKENLGFVPALQRTNTQHETNNLKARHELRVSTKVLI